MSGRLIFFLALSALILPAVALARLLAECVACDCGFVCL